MLFGEEDFSFYDTLDGKFKYCVGLMEKGGYNTIKVKCSECGKNCYIVSEGDDKIVCEKCDAKLSKGK